MNSLKKLALIGTVSLASISAPAITIDFEGESGFAGSIGEYIDVDGYRFTVTGGTGYFEQINGQSDIVESSTSKLFAANHIEITMTKVGGGAFSLSSVDIGGSWTDPNLFGRWADSVDVVAGSAVETADLSGGSLSYTTLSLPSDFNNVASVLFKPYIHPGGSPNDYEFTIDNLVVDSVSAVPDTGSAAALVATAIFALASSRRFAIRR